MNSDYDKIQKANSKLQKLNDALEDDKIFQQGEIDRLLKEIDIRILSENEIQDRCSCLKEELISIKEELNQIYLDKELLEQRCLELEVLQTKMEKNKGHFYIIVTYITNYFILFVFLNNVKYRFITNKKKAV